MNIQPGGYISLKGLTEQQIDDAIDRMEKSGGAVYNKRYHLCNFLVLDHRYRIWFFTDRPEASNNKTPFNELTIEQVLGVKSDVVKQERYLSEDGKDLIDKWAERYSPEEFRLIMFAMMEKYQERLGKKDSIAKECRKIADYANRLALVEEAREK